MPRIRVILTIAVLFTVGGIFWQLQPAGSDVDFNRDIRPIFNEKCVACHGGVRREADLSLLFRSDALEPAESGAHAIVPGRPGKSELIRRVTHSDPRERMPLEQPALTDREIDLLKDWIDQGALWRPHWAFVAPAPKELPEVSDPDWTRNGIDHFVMARLDRENIRPSPQADCAVLLRRVSLDLVGLPPAPEATDAFCEDPSSDRYERAVDSLLSSPRYGERWAAYWLDLARYADSNGYEKDEPRVMWKYRDWLIRAFNDNIPFDRFSTDQLAGDLLSNADTDQLIATAFHRNTMTNTEGGTDDEEFRVASVIDRLNTTFEVWQSTTIACVQCHGHPYDPIRHEEFYELLAFFNNTADADRYDNEPKLFDFNEEEKRGRENLHQLEQLNAQAQRAVDEDSLASWTLRLAAYTRDGNRPPRFEGHNVDPYVVRIGKKVDEERSPHERKVLRTFFIESRPEFEDLRDERNKLKNSILELEPVTTLIMEELPSSESRWTHVFERGNWLAPGRRVGPDVPRSLPALPEDAPPNRLGLAHWLFSPENPLTARVAVNRFWEQLFGTGIVETVEDFGTQGELPSHPELLDWLALQFADDFDWNVKQLLKEIVMSATYRQSSRRESALQEIDPYNRLLARGPRFRLSAEHVRDQALAVSGLLSGKMLGPSVFPPQPPGLWTNPYSSLVWKTSEGEDRYRRALYTFWRRTVPYPSIVAFDAPSREMCSSRRIRTNTPLQSLVTLNDPVYVEAAVALAHRMRSEDDHRVEDQLRRGYRLAMQRDPSAETLQKLVGLFEDALVEYAERPEDAAALLNIKQNAFADYEDVEPTNYGSRLEASSGMSTPRSSMGFAATNDDAREVAALAVVASAILNLDAFLTKE